MSTGFAFALLLCCFAKESAAALLATKPPMGWMSWEIFRCQTDCAAFPDTCIGETLYKTHADLLATGGYRDAGYDTIHIDDCWETQNPPRSSPGGELVPNATRFPSGFKALGDYVHAKNISFGIYSDMGTETCGGYPGSEGHEATDAATFASWGVDYLKLDGCYNTGPGYVTGYPKMGEALRASGRDIVYSCSWPAYLGSNETAKNYTAMIDAGCNLWRNWHDIQNSWESLSSIIEHYGEYSADLAKVAGVGPVNGGHWNDMDMLLAGAGVLTADQARVQLSVWSVLAAPLIMGNDLRQVTAEMKAILLNPEVIAVDQDAQGLAGTRVANMSSTSIWVRPLVDGNRAVLLLNSAPEAAADISFTMTQAGYAAGTVTIRDLWKREDVVHSQPTMNVPSYTAKAVPPQGCAFFLLSQ